jgi:Zn-dependent M28 family amino/carboxypeptidase
VSVDECTVRLRRHVQALAGDIGERNVWRPAALAAAAGYIRGEFEALGYFVAAQTYRVNDIDCDNLEVVIPGAARPEEIILVGAHYDTVEGSPGADDNATGVAGVLELARLLRGARLAITVKLVAFVNEEPPFFFFGEMGSKVYAEAARRRGDDIRLMLSLEMLGCY